jgi:hypothetical protein
MPLIAFPLARLALVPRYPMIPSNPEKEAECVPSESGAPQIGILEQDRDFETETSTQHALPDSNHRRELRILSGRIVQGSTSINPCMGIK